MPYCSKCGLQVEEYMQFCPNCGAHLKPQRELLEKHAVYAKSDTKPLLTSWNRFTNGLSIGLGAATLLGALAVAYYLNGSFWRLRESLTANGLVPQHINFLLSDIRVLIGAAALFAILGLYLIVLGVVSQLSPTARAILNSRNMRVRWGIGCFVGALIWTASSVQNLVWNIYSLYPFDVWISIGFGIGSIFLFLIGLFLVMTARTK